MVEEDFDICEIIQNQRQMKFEVQVMMGKLQIIGDPMFDEVIQDTIIDLAEGEPDGDKTPSIPTKNIGNEHIVELTDQKKKDSKDEQKQKDMTVEESNGVIEKNKKPADSFKLPPIN